MRLSTRCKKVFLRERNRCEWKILWMIRFALSDVQCAANSGIMQQDGLRPSFYLCVEQLHMHMTASFFKSSHHHTFVIVHHHKSQSPCPTPSHKLISHITLQVRLTPSYLRGEFIIIKPSPNSTPPAHRINCPAKRKSYNPPNIAPPPVITIAIHNHSTSKIIARSPKATAMKWE